MIVAHIHQSVQTDLFLADPSLFLKFPIGGLFRTFAGFYLPVDKVQSAFEWIFSAFAEKDFRLFFVENNDAVINCFY
jgi:hypothetical protein